MPVDAGSNRARPTEHILYNRKGGSLLVVPFDLERLKVTGSPGLIMEGINAKSASAAAQFAFSSPDRSSMCR